MSQSNEFQDPGADRPSTGRQSRRNLLATAVAAALASPLLSAPARRLLSPLGAQSGLTPMDTLAAMASSCDMGLLMSRLPLLAIAPVVAGNTTTGAASMQAAMDVLEELVNAGVNSIAVPVALESMGPTYYPGLVATNAPDGTPMIDYMRELGHPDVGSDFPEDLDLSQAYQGRQTQSGIENLSLAQLTSIRQSIQSLLVQKPLLCAGLVVGASASIGALTLPETNVALGLATVGFMSTGAAASLI